MVSCLPPPHPPPLTKIFPHSMPVVFSDSKHGKSCYANEFKRKIKCPVFNFFLWNLFIVFIGGYCRQFLLLVFAAGLCWRSLLAVFAGGLCWQLFYAISVKRIGNCKNCILFLNHTFSLSFSLDSYRRF